MVIEPAGERARRSTAVGILKTLESRARGGSTCHPFVIALGYDALGQTEPALTVLEQAYRDRAVEFAQMSGIPRLRPSVPIRGTGH